MAARPTRARHMFDLSEYQLNARSRNGHCDDMYEVSILCSTHSLPTISLDQVSAQPDVIVRELGGLHEVGKVELSGSMDT